jgi:hypothetical protein
MPEPIEKKVLLRRINSVIRKVMLPAVLLFAILGGLWKWIINHDPATGIAGVIAAFGVVSILELIYRRSGDFGRRN